MFGLTASKQDHLYTRQNRRKKKKNLANAKWAKYIVKPNELNKGKTISKNCK